MIDRDLSHILEGRVEPRVVRDYLQDVRNCEKMAETTPSGHKKYTHPLAAGLCAMQWKYQQATRLTLVTQDGEFTVDRPSGWFKAPPRWCPVDLAGF